MADPKSMSDRAGPVSGEAAKAADALLHCATRTRRSLPRTLIGYRKMWSTAGRLLDPLTHDTSTVHRSHAILADCPVSSSARGTVTAAPGMRRGPKGER
jgi:hypothetical protein